MTRLFTPLALKDVTYRNRIFVSPMCQYSSEAGMPTDWHLVHLGSRAVGGAGLVMVEASGVSPVGRISPWDSGIWSAVHAEAFRRITGFIEAQGAVPGIQIAHAGRKASTRRPWEGKPGAVPPEEGGWETIGPGTEPFAEGYPAPRAMTEADIDEVAAQFAAAAKLAVRAGFRTVEIHMAHGYLMHEFLSPLVNRRTDSYGGSFENRTRFPLRVARAVREAWPEELPLFVRISATDWVQGGWDVEQSVKFARELKAIGVDLVDCSSAGAVPGAKVPVGPGYQTALAARVRAEADIATGAVGMITSPAQAETILATGQADAILMGREFLRDPYWPLHAARALGADVPWPNQYLRARL
jgi:2,4-dienoyl-CoA reductase-like NADH-dependent reductase (Old Yellow Enzyme family)